MPPPAARAGVMVRVDLRKIAAAAGATLPTRDDTNRMILGLGAAAMAFWKKQAQQKLRSTSRDYVLALTSESGDRKFTISLDGQLPNLIENGFKGGDMRTWMLNGKRVKQGKRGRYLVIPFQHGTPGTTSRNVGPPMPSSIHQAAKQLAPTLSRPARAGGGRTVRYGGRLTERSKDVNQQAHELLTQKVKPWHSSSIYRGMIREAKTFKKTTQTTGYTTFRTISENVIRGEKDAEGRATQHWFHPGIRAAHFAQQTQKQVRKIARTMLIASMKDKGER